jgi:hypothetical protein
MIDRRTVLHGKDPILLSLWNTADRLSFNCLLPSFECMQFATCDKYNGKCACPPGFGKEDCSEPGKW